MISMADGIHSVVKLNDGVAMPIFGLGTAWTNECADAVTYAIQQGYRMIDTAQRYGNEEDVGKGIARCGKDRKDLFIVTKQWHMGNDVCIQGLQRSLARLDMNYIDLFLIHGPREGRNVETYKAMLELKKQGLVRSVGVSNFNLHHLEGLRNAGLPTPSVNQIELHPWLQPREIIDYCKKHDITVMGYSPLVKSKMLKNQQICDLAKKYNKTPAQILIRWSVQHGYSTIPKSSKSNRIKENMQVFDWTITEDDMDFLDQNNVEEIRCAWDPINSDWLG